MADTNLHTVLKRLYEAKTPDRADIECALSIEQRGQKAELFGFADMVRRRHVGDGIILRGIVEFSNYCRNTCLYCGLNKNNKKLRRYKLSGKELLKSINQIASARIRTVVLQSGEDKDLDTEWLARIIRSVKSRFDLAVTLSVGERSFDDYALWKAAGADRYLLKIETTNSRLYTKLHPGMSFENRLECSLMLDKLGYQNGSGCIIGLPGQTIADIAEDILFFAGRQFDMLGIGPLIPHPRTSLAGLPPGDVEMVLKAIAVTRIVTKSTHIPATTAIGSLNGNDYRKAALMTGANVIMPNFTPTPYRELYEIYPGKRCVNEKPGLCSRCMETMACKIGRTIDYSRGDSLKMCKKECA